MWARPDRLRLCCAPRAKDGPHVVAGTCGLCRVKRVRPPPSPLPCPLRNATLQLSSRDHGGDAVLRVAERGRRADRLLTTLRIPRNPDSAISRLPPGPRAISCEALIAIPRAAGASPRPAPPDPVPAQAPLARAGRWRGCSGFAPRRGGRPHTAAAASPGI
jgi:hypothetical protein